jgi:hypothetical protein
VAQAARPPGHQAASRTRPPLDHRFSRASEANPTGSDTSDAGFLVAQARPLYSTRKKGNLLGVYPDLFRCPSVRLSVLAKISFLILIGAPPRI